MKEKIVCISTILIATIIVLGCLSPQVYSKDIDTVTIEVNRYYGKKSTICTDVSIEEAEEIKQILIKLNNAIENNDEEVISECEKILNDKGIFGKNHQKFFSSNKYSEAMEQTNLVKYTKYFGAKNGDNISNYMCYFNAICGQGLMLWWFGLKAWQSIIDAIKNVSNPIAAFILFLALLPFLVIILLLTDLLPFRIMSPSGVIALQNGSVSSLGLKGIKRLKVGEEPIEVNISWFTGITINIPTSFIFISGIALEVKES